MSAKAVEINDPTELVRRVAYRTQRSLDRAQLHDDPLAFMRMMTSRNRTDLRRALELMESDPDGA
jgi:hypothetical protein